MSTLLELKAESYDVLIEIEGLKNKVAELEKKKEVLSIKIKTLTTPIKPVNTQKVSQTSDELRIKEQEIIEKRLQRIGKK